MSFLLFSLRSYSHSSPPWVLGPPKTYQPKHVFLKITNQKFDENSHRQSETKIAKTLLTGTKPTYDEIQKKFGMYLVCSVSQICRYVGCLRVDLLFLRSARTAFFDMRICSHIGPKLACRRPGTKYCVDLFFISEHFGTLPPLCVIFFR